jgi:UDP-GlcNAc:undecaprenyl-phosphate GlcNAc-1-phosphate transferase
VPAELGLAAVVALAGALTLILTLAAISLACRIGFFDVPERYKAHARATPYLGGAAVTASLSLAAVVWLVWMGEWRFVAIPACAVALCIVGTIDDRRFLRPLLRVSAEVGAGIVLWSVDLGWSVFDSDLANLALTCLWVVGLVNSFNLLDNMDGAASAIAVASAVGIAAAGLVVGSEPVAAIDAALAGACAGFLRFNLTQPARIFLGDGGSMPIGLVVAATSMAAMDVGGGRWSDLVVAILLVGVPAFDTTLVVVSRLRRRVSILTGGRDHVTHRLARRLRSERVVSLLLSVLQIALAMAALVARELGTGEVLGLAGAAVLLLALAIAVLEGPAWMPDRQQVAA